MIKENLIRFLNRHWGIQTFFAILPAIFIVLYEFVFMQDLANIIGTLDHNNKITSIDLNAEELKEVKAFTENEDGSYTVEVSDSYSVEESVNYGDIIYTVFYDSMDLFKLLTNSGQLIYTEGCNVIDNTKLEDDGIKVEVDGTWFDLDESCMIGSVYLSNDGQYEVEYCTDLLDNKNMDNLTGVEVKLVTDSYCKLSIDTSYDMKIESLDVNFVSILSDDNIYYNIATKQFVKNISSDFENNYILGSNIIVVFFSMGLYTVLIMIISKENKLDLISRNEPTVINIFTLVVLLLSSALVYLLI